MKTTTKTMATTRRGAPLIEGLHLTTLHQLRLGLTPLPPRCTVQPHVPPALQPLNDTCHECRVQLQCPLALPKGQSMFTGAVCK